MAPGLGARASPVHPGAHGFDEWFSAPNFYDNDPILSRRGTAVRTEGESSMVTVDAALEWIGAVAGQASPFLAVVWFGSPHSPHQPAEQDRALYEDQPERLQNFYGEITGMDRAFGKLRESLDALGIRDNTLLWYCSDNGALRDVGSTGGHRGHKGNLYEGGLLVPGILEWPARIAEGRASAVRCNTSDIYPTLLEIVGVTVENQPVLDGISLVPLIDGRMQDRPGPMGFWNYPAPGIGTPSAQWMGELLKAQQAGGDLPPHPSSLNAARLPDPPFPLDSFPGHAPGWTAIGNCIGSKPKTAASAGSFTTWPPIRPRPRTWWTTSPGAQRPCSPTSTTGCNRSSAASTAKTTNARDLGHRPRVSCR
jgi:hypothetical protein